MGTRRFQTSFTIVQSRRIWRISFVVEPQNEHKLDWAEPLLTYSEFVSNLCLWTIQRKNLTLWGPWNFQIILQKSSFGFHESCWVTQYALQTENSPDDDDFQIILSCPDAWWGGGIRTILRVISLGNQRWKRSKFLDPSGRTISWESSPNPKWRGPR